MFPEPIIAKTEDVKKDNDEKKLLLKKKKKAAPKFLTETQIRSKIEKENKAKDEILNIARKEVKKEMKDRATIIEKLRKEVEDEYKFGGKLWLKEVNNLKIN